MSDIETREDIERLVNTFYEKVVPDALIGKYFTEVVHFSWEVHIPVMISFWETVLLGQQSYKGNPMIKHKELHQLMPLHQVHFERWLYLWQTTIRELFEGEHAQTAIDRAHSIAKIIEAKLSNS